MSVKIIQYFKQFDGILMKINEESEYNFQIHHKDEKIQDINVKLFPEQFFWISWSDVWEDKILEIYSNCIRIKTYRIYGIRTIQKRILDKYDINFLKDFKISV